MNASSSRRAREKRTAPHCATLSCPELAICCLRLSFRPLHILGLLPSFRPPSRVPRLPLSCHFRAAFPWPPAQPQLLSDTHCITLHMKMSCHIFQPLKQRLFFGEVVLTVLPCSSQAEHRAGGEEEGGYSRSTHMQGSWLCTQKGLKVCGGTRSSHRVWALPRAALSQPKASC